MRKGQPLVNQTEWHAQARTLFFFFCKHLADRKLLPIRGKKLATSAYDHDYTFLKSCDLTHTERVGPFKVEAKARCHGRAKDGDVAIKWDELARFELVMSVSFRDCFFWTTIMLDASDRESYEIVGCMLGTEPPRQHRFERIMRRFDALMVMKKMVDAQADYV